MRQLLLPEGLKSGSYFIATDKDFHYLSHVLRLKKGAELKGLDTKGQVYRLILEKCFKDRLYFKVLSSNPQESQSNKEKIQLELWCCLPKLSKMDLIVRMASEIGVSRIVPVFSERSLVKATSEKALLPKINRWQKIARAAVEQSGRPDLPEIAQALHFKDIETANQPNELNLFAWEEIKKCLSLYSSLQKVENLAKIRFLVGPEGGFSQNEVKLLTENNFKPIKLNNNIMRTETAAVFFCAAISLLLMEKDIWK